MTYRSRALRDLRIAKMLLIICRLSVSIPPETSSTRAGTFPI